MPLKGVIRVGNTTSLLSGKGACAHPILSLHWNPGGAPNHCWVDWEFWLPIRPPQMPPWLGWTGAFTVHWHLGVEEMTSLPLGRSERPDSLARLPLTLHPPPQVCVGCSLLSGGAECPGSAEVSTDHRGWKGAHYCQCVWKAWSPTWLPQIPPCWGLP